MLRRCDCCTQDNANNQHQRRCKTVPERKVTARRQITTASSTATVWQSIFFFQAWPCQVHKSLLLSRSSREHGSGVDDARGQNRMTACQTLCIDSTMVESTFPAVFSCRVCGVFPILKSILAQQADDMDRRGLLRDSERRRCALRGKRSAGPACACSRRRRSQRGYLDDDERHAAAAGP
jgi:hypothetical protein